MEIFGTPATSVLAILGLSIFGFVLHVLAKAAELREADPTFTLTRYFSRNPYRSLGKLGAVVGAAVGLAEPNITPIAAVGAIGIGYAADSAMNRLRPPKLPT